ncbi:MAG: glycosyltransferase family 39 protein [Chloroflexi bacterium]|nr:glycosyltransferase family 39 protein [Chloroflexota bacterium]
MTIEPDQSKENNLPEPSVLDWFKSLLRLRPIPIPSTEEAAILLPDQDEQSSADQSELGIGIEDQVLADLFPSEEQSSETAAAGLPNLMQLRNLRFPVAIFCALVAQAALSSKPNSLLFPIIFYVWGIVLVGWATFAGDFSFVHPGRVQDEIAPSELRPVYLVLGAGFAMLTFLTSLGNLFNVLNLVFWIAALGFTLSAFWEGELPLDWLRRRLKKSNEIIIRPSKWNVLVVLSGVLIIFFRVSQLNSVPSEMWSDHAEKLLDVMDILAGKFSIFFTRNTGREALQFYLAAATEKALGTGISFLTLKLGTVLAGLITLPFIYLFAKEYADRRVGLLAMYLAGIAYWPNVISRVGLRYPFYPLVAAAALYFLLRGIRLKSRNSFLAAGFAIGLGLHGYSPARVIPIAAALGVLLYLLHQKRNVRQEVRATTVRFIMLALIALVVFMPLLGAISQMPGSFMARALSRISTTERALSEPALTILFKNLWNALRMFAWDNGEIWVISIPHRPALDTITGAAFHLGVVIVFIRYLQKRRWQDIYLLLLIPVLMSPSILSLAFPNENPALNRAAGAIIPVFTIAAIPFALAVTWINERIRINAGKIGAYSVIAMLLLFSSTSNYGLVFKTYAKQHREGTWNTSEVGGVIRAFAASVGSYDTAYLVAFPHWLDHRLVAMIAGAPGVDNRILPEEISSLESVDEMRLFIFKSDDLGAFDVLLERFPDGLLRPYASSVPSREFNIYIVPSEIGSDGGEVDQ